MEYSLPVTKAITILEHEKGNWNELISTKLANQQTSS